jgi:integrase
VSIAFRVASSRGKTERSRRRVALDKATVAALRGHRKRQAAERLALGPGYEDHWLVFCREHGTLLDPERVSQMFRGHVESAGLPRIPLKNLCHTWASLAVQAGVNPKVVSERLSLATVSFTLDTYSHVLPGIQEDAAARVAASSDSSSGARLQSVGRLRCQAPHAGASQARRVQMGRVGIEPTTLRLRVRAPS